MRSRKTKSVVRKKVWPRTLISRYRAKSSIRYCFHTFQRSDRWKICDPIGWLSETFIAYPTDGSFFGNSLDVLEPIVRLSSWILGYSSNEIALPNKPPAIVLWKSQIPQIFDISSKIWGWWRRLRTSRYWSTRHHKASQFTIKYLYFIYYFRFLPPCAPCLG